MRAGAAGVVAVRLARRHGLSLPGWRCGALLGVVCGVLMVAVSAQAAPVQRTVQLADMTAPEVAAALRAGKTTIIIPTGGTEQNGPHLPLGKHNIIVAAIAGSIAEALGNALVAPVVAYVPEGRITPPEGHMRFAGTISLREETFAALLTDAAESFRQHGFQLIVFLGDSGGNQAGQTAVAERLNRQWVGEGASARVLAVTDYYAANGQEASLVAQGFTPAQIGQHAGMRDTAELLALAPGLVRREVLPPVDRRTGETFDGAPELATPAMGAALLDRKVAAAVAQIREGVPPSEVKKAWYQRWLSRGE